MGESERTWGSKGRASWKVTLSSRRWVLYRFGLPHPVLPFSGLVHHPLSRSHIFFFLASLSVFSFAEALAMLLISSIRTCPQSVHLSSPPFFFPWEFELSSIQLPPSLAPSFIGITSPPSSLPSLHPTHPTHLSSHPLMEFALPSSISGPPVSAPGHPPALPFPFLFSRIHTYPLYAPSCRRSVATLRWRYGPNRATIVGVLFPILAPNSN
jgi:hypothetical protein